MHKTQVFIRDDQYDALQEIIALTGEKQSALIREGIDLFIRKITQEQRWKEKLMALSGSLTEEEANEMKADIQKSRESWKNRR
jgi:Arc/MetJ-type ribon-helix-helix transcriptional regulator